MARSGAASSDVLIIGAGIVGAACAYFATRAGLSVTVLERGAIASGTSSAGEGNILVSDKEAGPELELALYSQSVWRTELAEFADLWEFDSKGGLVVASSRAGAAALAALAARQRARGIQVTDVAAEQLNDYEPELSRELSAGAFYPQDAQVQPMLVVAHLLRMARSAGAIVHTTTEVTGFTMGAGAITGVTTSKGIFQAENVINAAGTWAGNVAALAGVSVPVLPRRGFVLVTEPMQQRVHHKVYAAEYVENVASSDAGIQTSPVVEGTESGTILIGSSRERVGFDSRFSLPAVAMMARQAIALFPMLAHATVIRSYRGFRPYCPDHLPVIGADARAPGLWHACGHEGAGIGLSVGTAAALMQALCGAKPPLDLTPFAPERFEAAA